MMLTVSRYACSAAILAVAIALTVLVAIAALSGGVDYHVWRDMR